MTKTRLILLAGLLALVVLAGCRSAHTTAAILYIDEHNYDKAVQVIHEGFQYRDDEPDAYFYLGEAYSHLAEEAVEEDDYLKARKNYKLAYEAYIHARDLGNEEIHAEVDNSLNYNYGNRIRQASLDWQQEYFEQAEGHLRLAYAALPDSLTPIKSIARMKMEMADMDSTGQTSTALRESALELLDQALATNPEAYGLNLDKANVLDKLGRDTEAGIIYAKLLEEHGDDTGLLMDIANLSVEEGDVARAADFYVKIVDLNEADTDAGNDGDNKALLKTAGSWYSSPQVGRYEDGIAALERAAMLDQLGVDDSIMLLRLKAQYYYGKSLKNEAETETDLVLKEDLQKRSRERFDRAVEIGVAMTSSFPTNAEGFLYLSMSQLETGDFNASDANYKTFQELSGESGL
ncbi:hypothetical protein CSB20_14625 [bacterium DOLZORAL124_64_63]|nr:MAG: hypothetical protein CSB20_14625 [bacterium DOLZORAL124_64_63]